MAAIHSLVAAYGWQASLLAAAVIAGVGFQSYGRMLERKTREHGEQQSR